MRPHLYVEPDLPNDEELERLTDYLGGFMTEADEAAFDEQLASDEAFYHRMAPMLKVWYVRTLPPSIMQAGVRINERRAEEHRLAVQRRRARTIRLASFAAAASVIFGMVQTGVVQVALRGGSEAATTLAQKTPPATRHKTTIASTPPATPKPRPERKAAVVARPKEVAVTEVVPEAVPLVVPINDSTSDRVIAEIGEKPVNDPAFARISIDPLGPTAEPLTPVRQTARVDTAWLDPQRLGKATAPGVQGSSSGGFHWPSWLHWPW